MPSFRDASDMQPLWSRAAQAPLCACRACTHVSGTAIRRTTTAVHRRRKPEFAEVFTAFYTTILGTAAVLDARYKAGRRRELDRKIEETRRSLAHLREVASSPSSSSSSSPPAFQDDTEDSSPPARRPFVMRPPAPRNAIEALKSICKMDDSLARHHRSMRQLRFFLRTIHRTYDPEETLGNRYADYLGSNLDAIDAAIQQEAMEDGSTTREPLTTVQFEKYHGMINRMVDKLIIQSYYDELPQDPDRARKGLESLDSAWTAIRMLRSEGYPRYNHPAVDPVAAKQQQDQLTNMIRTLFDEWDKDKQKAKPKFQVAKICYNLLVCPFPPNIYHYNLLLLGFSRKNMHNLNDIVAESLLEDSRLRPTTQTIVCLLLHYRRKRDIHGFYGIIRRMTAIDNRGMLIRRKWHEDVVNISTLREWARRPEVLTSLKANWVIELPSRTQDIYEALVSGLLSFGRVKDAVKVFVGSLQERVGTSVELFIYMLKYCLYRLDVAAADILLRGLIDNAEVMVSLIFRSNCPRRLAEHLYPILNMGKPPSWPFSQERAQVMWYSGTLAISPEDRGRIRLLTTAMFIRQTETQLSRVQFILRRMKRMLEFDNPLIRTSIALRGISEYNEIKGHHQYLAGRLLKHQALLKVSRTLERYTRDMRTGNIRAIYHRAIPVLERTLPHLAKAGGHEWMERLEEIHVVADEWFRYRIVRMPGVDNEARRLMAQAELALFIGQRLWDDTWRHLPQGVRWKHLNLESIEGQMNDSDDGEGQRRYEQPSEEGGLWPKTEANAVWATGPGSLAVRVS